ncbi:MAG: hypothetical protein R3195_01970 [Gemmatimonadota bacterium]|nr:hypothetical protein [Gemmatimonadota bacterium]
MRMTRLRKLLVPVLAAFVAVGCSDDDDDPMGPGGGPPPDLSGTYDLVSFTPPGSTTPIGPPIADGTFVLNQTSSSDTEASGDVDLDITIPDGMGGQNTIMESGTYTIRSDGTWEQESTTLQTVGTYTLVGSTLTVIVTDPPQAATTSVWQRQ